MQPQMRGGYRSGVGLAVILGGGLLLGQTVQASPPDSVVTLTVRSVRRANGEGICRVEVCDQGPGIPSEHHDDVFTPFFTTN